VFVKKRSTQGYHRLESFEILVNQRLVNALLHQVDTAASNQFQLTCLLHKVFIHL